MPDVVVVGAGPNGLTAAAVLGRAGLDVTVLEANDTIGGGARSAELTLPGLVHDVCSGFHAFGAASPVLAALPLEDHGLEWAHPEIPLAHPLEGGRAGLLHRSIADTGAGLGADAGTWRSLLGPLVTRFDDLVADVLRPVLHVPRHPLTLARFGLPALLPASLLARRLSTPAGRALLAGTAAHAFQPLTNPLTSALGLVLAAAAHAVGWPVAAGGSQAITDALVAELQAHGGSVRTGVRVSDLDELPRSRAVLLDLTPPALIEVAGERLPPRSRRRLARWEFGPAAFKLDLAVEGGVPWQAPGCRRAGTVHVGGTLDEVAAAERAVADGRMPERPFVLVGQQYLADPGRSADGVHPVWAYAHVPNGYPGDATPAILDQIERFAPGLRERIVGRHAAGPAALEADNANYVGGDISSGAITPWQLVARPRLSPNPYATGIPGVWLCSAATPPGPGVHGMCGYNAAKRVLRELG